MKVRSDLSEAEEPSNLQRSPKEFITKHRRLIIVLSVAFAIQFAYWLLLPYEFRIDQYTLVKTLWDPGWFDTVPYAYSKLAVENNVLPYAKALAGYPFKTLEYPFLMGYVFYLIYLVSGGSFSLFVTIFQFINVSFQSGSAGLIFLLLSRFQNSRHAAAISLLYVATPATLYFTMSRYDPIPTFFALLSIYLFLLRRHRLAFAFMGLGALTKIYPALLGLVYFKHGLLNRQMRGYYLQLVGIPFAVLIVGIIPLVLTNLGGLLTLLLFLEQFGWNWESIYGPIDQFVRPILPQLAYIYVHQEWMRVIFVLACLSVLLLDVKTERRVALAAAYSITAWMETQWFFSPQYFLWIAPLMLVIAATFPALSVYFFLAFVMTLEIPSPFYYLVPIPQFYYGLTISAIRWLVLLAFMLMLLCKIQGDWFARLGSKVASYWAEQE
jgi:hypothetical protein